MPRAVDSPQDPLMLALGDVQTEILDTAPDFTEGLLRERIQEIRASINEGMNHINPSRNFCSPAIRLFQSRV